MTVTETIITLLDGERPNENKSSTKTPKTNVGARDTGEADIASGELFRPRFSMKKKLLRVWKKNPIARRIRTISVSRERVVVFIIST